MSRCRSGFWWLCCFTLLSTLVTAGCSPEARHQVLTIFFTGVPPLGWEEEAQRLAEAGMAGGRLPRRDDSGGFVHGPYGARECGSCHEMVPPPRAGEKSTRIVVGQFVLPRGEMCISCHTEKTADRARTAGLWRHGPSDNCLSCHHPHASGQAALLRRAVGELCLSCHSEGLIHAAELHEGLTACMDCHNPHLGQSPMMLRWDYEEIF